MILPSPRKEGVGKPGGQKLREETKEVGNVGVGESRKEVKGRQQRARTEKSSERWTDRLAAPQNTGSRWLWSQLHQCPDAQQSPHNRTGTGTPEPRHKTRQVRLRLATV